MSRSSGSQMNSFQIMARNRRQEVMPGRAWDGKKSLLDDEAGMTTLLQKWKQYCDASTTCDSEKLRKELRKMLKGDVPMTLDAPHGTLYKGRPLRDREIEYLESVLEKLNNELDMELGQKTSQSVTRTVGDTIIDHSDKSKDEILLAVNDLSSRLEAQEALREVIVVCAGDSHFGGLGCGRRERIPFKLSMLLPFNHRVIPLGFSGARADRSQLRTSFAVSKQMRDLLSMDPAPGAVMMSLGTNDSRAGIAVGAYAEQYKEILQTIRLEMPEARLCVVEPLGQTTRDDIKVAARSVASQCGAIYVELASLDLQYRPDRVHLAERGVISVGQKLATELYCGIATGACAKFGPPGWKSPCCAPLKRPGAAVHSPAKSSRR